MRAWIGRFSVVLCGLPVAWADVNGLAGPYTIGAFIRAPNLSDLVKRTLAVSDPKSELYGSYYSQAELAKAIGVTQDDVDEASSWLRESIRKLNATDVPHHVASHSDVVSITLPDFQTTYMLGAGLAGVAVKNAAAPDLPQAPATLELLVTPPTPPHYCEGFDYEELCNSKSPCKWKVPQEKQHKYYRGEQAQSDSNSTDDASDGGHCTGDFDGWVCWPEAAVDGQVPRWHCFEPRQVAGVNQSSVERRAAIWRERRRGKRVDLSSAAAQHKRRADGRPTPMAQTYGDLGFRVSPQSRGLAFTFDTMAAGHHNKTKPWKTVEVTYRQLGVYFTRVLPRAAFNASVPKSPFLTAHVGGLTNLEPVDMIAVCVNEPDTVVDVMLSAATFAALGQPGCDCNEETGVDKRLGRDCDVLRGIAPAQDPIDFVLPRGQQTLNALLKDVNIPGGRFQDSGGVRLAVGEFAFQTFLQDDVDIIRQAYGLEKLANDVTVVGRKAQPGEETNFSTSGEGSLDLQIASILSPKSDLTWWAVSPYDMDGFMLAYAVQVNDAEDPPTVHSISWGAAEALYPPAFVTRMDYELMKLALRGITVIVASGDNGISAVNPGCNFLSDLAGSSPWVTAVGASMPSLASAPYCVEPVKEQLGACEEPGPITCATTSGAAVTSAGYWSVYRAEPAWQRTEVRHYLETSDCAPCNLTGASRIPTALKMPCQHINGKKGCDLATLLGKTRAAPDVAVPGSSFPTFVNKTLGILDGTSASAPVFAAVTALLNAEQRLRGQPPLGFLNPWMYTAYREHPGAFADVSVGDIGSTEAHQCDKGFKAAQGWDPATGVGVPRFLALRRLLPTAGGSPVLGLAEDDMRLPSERTEQLPAAPVAPAAVSLAAGAEAPTGLGAPALLAAGAVLLFAVAGRAWTARASARAPGLLLDAGAGTPGPEYHAWPGVA